MRSLVLLPLLILAACSDGADPNTDAKAKAEAAKNLKLAAGQWEMVAEVTKLTKQDDGTPAINTPEGTKTTGNHCVAQADVDAKQPSPTLLAGEDYKDCKYDNFYMSAGTLNAQMTCRRDGLNGEVRMTVDGSYTADTIEANQSLSTYLPGSGDVNIQSKLTGRRTGAACAPTAEEAKKA
jgi:hypothetical protein